MAKKALIPIQRPAQPALGEKIAALDAADYLESHAARATRTRFRRALARVPDIPEGCRRTT